MFRVKSFYCRSRPPRAAINKWLKEMAQKGYTCTQCHTVNLRGPYTPLYLILVVERRKDLPCLLPRERWLSWWELPACSSHHIELKWERATKISFQPRRLTVYFDFASPADADPHLHDWVSFFAALQELARIIANEIGLADEWSRHFQDGGTSGTRDEES